jgi:transposase
MLGEHEPNPQLSFLLPPVLLPSAKRDLLQALDRLVDWSIFRELARPYFSAEGRPSLDPVVMVKMMVVGMLFGFTSDRCLVEECGDSRALEEFLGYQPGEPLPVHASFTHWRQRLGPDFFRAALHQVVTQAGALGRIIHEPAGHSKKEPFSPWNLVIWSVAGLPRVAAQPGAPERRRFWSARGLAATGRHTPAWVALFQRRRGCRSAPGQPRFSPQAVQQQRPQTVKER